MALVRGVIVVVVVVVVVAVVVVVVGCTTGRVAVAVSRWPERWLDHISTLMMNAHLSLLVIGCMLLDLPFELLLEFLHLQL